MQNLSSTRAAAAAMLVATLVILSTYAFGRALRGQDLRGSHQLPTPENWFEAGTKTSPTLVATGRKLFLANCAHCHGADARGDEGPDLYDVEASDRYISTIVTRGVPHEMPSFAKKLDANDLTALTAYIRSLH